VFNVIIGSTNYGKVSSSLLTLEALAAGETGGSEIGYASSCLLAGSTVTGIKKTPPANKYCYKDRQGPDLCNGIIVECKEQSTYSSPCTDFSCNTKVQWCYLSSTSPTSDNFK
jgi:hypothetical protein